MTSHGDCHMPAIRMIVVVVDRRHIFTAIRMVYWKSPSKFKHENPNKIRGNNHLELASP